jgi:hypothetical protein
MKKRIKKFLKDRKPEDLVTAIVPASLVCLYMLHQKRGMEVVQLRTGHWDDGTEGIQADLKNGQIISFHLENSEG